MPNDSVENFLARYQVARLLVEYKDQSLRIAELEMKLARTERSASALKEALQFYRIQGTDNGPPSSAGNWNDPT